jgi:predicted phage tail protein
MLRKIKLYGRLAKFVGQRVFEADVASAAEAVRFLLANFPQLEKHMADQHYRVSTGAVDLTLDEVHYPAGQEEVRIVPVVAGAGSSVGKIIAGVALIAISLALPGGGLFGGSVFGAFGGPIAAAGTLTTVGTVLSAVGATLILGGVAQLLTPTPKINAPGTPQDNSDPRKSYSFSGIQQTSRQGVPVPIVYGETIVGSVVVSAGIDTVQVAA